MGLFLMTLCSIMSFLLKANFLFFRLVVLVNMLPLPRCSEMEYCGLVKSHLNLQKNLLMIGSHIKVIIMLLTLSVASD